MTTFTLIGRPFVPFRLVRRLQVCGIDCVYGQTLDGRFQTTARAVDVIMGAA